MPEGRQKRILLVLPFILIEIDEVDGDDEKSVLGSFFRRIVFLLVAIFTGRFLSLSSF